MNRWLSIIHPEGWRFIGIFCGATLLFFLFSDILGIIGLTLTCWCAYFFRDPKRIVPSDKSFVISPADGRVVAVKTVIPPKELELDEEETYRISIFLNVFDVHVNRAPIAGTIERVIYYPGKFFNASLDKASEHNERNAVVIKTEKDLKVGVIQIAGLIARRIVSTVKQGDSIDSGERYGIIRFGSRADVYLPKGILPLVVEGQRTVGGETVLANVSGKQKLAEGTEA